MESINPATGELIERFDAHKGADVEVILARADRAWHGWRLESVGHRAEVLRRAAEILRDRVDGYAALMTREMGKPIVQAKAETEKCAWVCDYYADHAEEFLAGRTVATGEHVSGVRYDPLGPVLAVMPWNFPFWQVFRFAAPALAAGNTALLKHAPNVARCALTIEEIFREAGAPEGVFSALLVETEAVAGVIADRRVRAVTLTGSDRAGRAVASQAGKALKKSVLELGGNDPFIVLADANVERAAEVGASARLMNNGQSCIAAKRFVLEKPIAEEFVEHFGRALRAAKVGDPADPETALGPVARWDLRGHLHAQVRALAEQGAAIEFGGEIPQGPGWYYPATLIAGVNMEMPAADEEIFGPVAVVLVAEDEKHAVEIANATRFGLGASLWTCDLDRARALIPRIEAGSVFVNGLVKSDPALPFGGIKDSGYGRELSAEGLREFVNCKTYWYTDSET
ncbi:MAG: NAD-dependent succinate-semialdehyde dehydrogenase [Deltaproteobacteria bacterium]|nr:NAD-dependent succinate-semialdehyde dehydrogenase [Deltaproteobacteria bacterium]